MSDQTYEYDLVCVGAGSGGVRASRFSAANYGAKVAIVELPFGFVSSESVGGAGGTCVIRGCVPKKLLVYGSEFSDAFADSQGFGWAPCKPDFDWNYLVENKGKEIKRLNGIYGSILKNAGVEQVEGRAHLKDAHTVQVFDPNDSSKLLRELTTKNVLIAVGAMAHRLPIPGAEHTITSDEALSLPKQPKKVAIIGAGYIAVEFSGIFGGLGTEVHLFYRKPYPLTGFDQECREMVAENLARRAHLHPECNPVRVDKLDDGTLNFTYKDSQGAEHSMVVDQVMMATGRVPKTKGLGLENAGVELNKGAVVVDDLQRTNVPGVWALGDVTDKIQLTPVALMEGMAFAATCFGGKEKKPDYEHVPSAVFCQPPLAKVGFSEEEAIERFGGNLDVYTSKFKPMKNTLSGREERTLMKMIVHRESDKVVGIHMVGPDAAEIMQGMAVALKAGATKAHFDTTVGIHPSAAEEFVTMRTASRSAVGKGTALP